MTHELRSTIFIVVSTLLILGYLVWVLTGPIKRFLYRHFTVRFYYPTVRQVALDHDFFLVNEFVGSLSGGDQLHIDHILIGEKYIYCIRDRYYPGTLLSDPEDEMWTFYSGKTKSVQISNPISINRFRVERLCLLAPIDRSIVIPIVLVNNDCYYTPFEQDDASGYFLSLKQLAKFVDLKEAEDVSPINALVAESLANDLSKMKSHDAK